MHTCTQAVDRWGTIRTRSALDRSSKFGTGRVKNDDDAATLEKSEVLRRTANFYGIRIADDQAGPIISLFMQTFNHQRIVTDPIIGKSRI